MQPLNLSGSIQEDKEKAGHWLQSISTFFFQTEGHDPEISLWHLLRNRKGQICSQAAKGSHLNYVYEILRCSIQNDACLRAGNTNLIDIFQDFTV